MENKKKKGTNGNLNYIFIGIICVLVLVILGFILVKGCSKENKENNNNDEVEKVGAKEEDIIKAYGMSKEDAINLVKTAYNGDNYEFSADINNDSKYIVKVTNTITNSTDEFLVDPTSSSNSFYLITE